ncbi:MAG: hypothetical protein NT018_10360 [Armatimonadetes bacterium]|nr:hypothetical protein [Armatimonadota bacterium]
MTLLSLIIGALIVGALLLWALMMAPARYRKPIVMAVTFLGGLVLALEFLIPKDNLLTDIMPSYANVGMVIGSFALLLGILNLFRIHGEAISGQKQGWGNSLAFFVAFFAIMIAGFLKDSSPTADNVFGMLFGGFLKPLQSTMFSLIAFYIASAAYRAFKIRSAESAFMMIAAAIIMLALLPIGVMITDWIPENSFFSIFRIEKLGYWILVSPNMAVQRAIAFGLAVGGLATGLRIWLSLEKGSFFDRQL